MGQRIQSPDIPHENDCNRCVPPTGSRWPAGETPKYVYCKFWQISNCGWSHHPAPNDQIFRLTQSGVQHCLWELVGSIWRVNFRADRIIPANSQLDLSDHDGFSFFTDRQAQCPAENIRWSNDQAACILFYAGAGGMAMVWWNDVLLDLVDWFRLGPGPFLFYEIFHVNVFVEVHRFANRYQRTNIKFKKI